MVVAPITAVPIRTGLAVALKVLPAESFFPAVPCRSQNRGGSRSLFDFLVNSLNLFDLRKFKHRLSIVGNRTVAVDGNRHRTHAEAYRRQPDRKRRHSG